MLLSVCMKDYVARSYGHTPRKLPLKSVPLRATSRFIAYQAETIIQYFRFLVNKMLKIIFYDFLQTLTLLFVQINQYNCNNTIFDAFLCLYETKYPFLIKNYFICLFVVNNLVV